MYLNTKYQASFCPITAFILRPIFIFSLSQEKAIQKLLNTEKKKKKFAKCSFLKISVIYIKAHLKYIPLVSR